MNKSKNCDAELILCGEVLGKIIELNVSFSNPHTKYVQFGVSPVQIVLKEPTVIIAGKVRITKKQKRRLDFLAFSQAGMSVKIKGNIPSNCTIKSSLGLVFRKLEKIKGTLYSFELRTK